jgi:hypothetical protein
MDRFVQPLIELIYALLTPRQKQLALSTAMAVLQGLLDSFKPACII